MIMLERIDLVNYYSVDLDQIKLSQKGSLDAILDFHDKLTSDDIATIRDQAFYDDLHDTDLPITDLLDKHFLGHLEDYQPNRLILTAIQEIYSYY